jgi:HEAT repeat protein
LLIVAAVCLLGVDLDERVAALIAQLAPAPEELPCVQAVEPGGDGVGLDLMKWCDDERWDKTIKELTAIGQPAVPALATALHDPDCRTRRAAAEILGRIGPAARDAVPALMDALPRPPNSRVCGRAAESGPIDVRTVIAVSLGQIGPDARAAIPALTRTMVDGDNNWLRIESFVTLEKIDPKGKPNVAAIHRALLGPDRARRRRAARTVEGLSVFRRRDIEGDELIPAIESAANDPDPQVGEPVRWVVQRLRAPDHDADPASDRAASF